MTTTPTLPLLPTRAEGESLIKAADTITLGQFSNELELLLGLIKSELAIRAWDQHPRTYRRGSLA
ncbi:MAG: hypothetical protein KAX64_00570 [Chromatiaceae bacterium]|nr:hypothetical protein [Chromatiaceae bacterium]